MGEDQLTDPTRPKALALERKEEQLVERIDKPQTAAELKAVDDDRRVRETDVLRAEIAMALDDSACIGPLLQGACGTGAAQDLFAGRGTKQDLLVCSHQIASRFARTWSAALTWKTQ